MTSRFTKFGQNRCGVKKIYNPISMGKFYFFMRQSCVLLFLLCCLTGCHNKLFQDKLDQYANSMAQSLGISIPSTPSLTLSYPNRKLLEYTAPETSINFSEFYELSECGAATLIAQRNTTLGKVQLPSQRFIYEVKLLESLRECRQHYEDQALQQRIDQLIDIKQSQFQGVWSNLVQLSEETKIQFATNQMDFIEMEFDQINLVVQALKYLNHLQLASNNTEDLEAQLNVLRQYPLLAAGWRMQMKAQFLLSRINEALSEKLTQGGCLAGPVASFDNFKNELAPAFDALLLLLDRTHPVLESWSNNSGLVGDFRTYLSDKLASTERFKQTLAQHNIMLSQLEQTCLAD